MRPFCSPAFSPRVPADCGDPRETYPRDSQLKVGPPDAGHVGTVRCNSRADDLGKRGAPVAEPAFADESVDIRDFAFLNGVVRKLVTYQIVER